MKIASGYKIARRPDITTKTPDGSMYRENIGKSTTNGYPIARERRALDDLRSNDIPVGYTPYDR